MNLNDLRKIAENADIDPSEAGGGRTTLSDGETYALKVERVRRNDPAKKKRDGFGVMFRIEDGPDNKNRVYWDNFTIVEEHPNLVSRTLYQLEQIFGEDGLQTLFSTGDESTLTKSLAGATVECVAGFRGDFADNKYTALDSTPVVVVAEDDDDDLSWDQ